MNRIEIDLTDEQLAGFGKLGGVEWLVKECERNKPTARDAAVVWLADALAAGPRAAEELWGAALEVGITPQTLNRAKVIMGIRSERKGFGPGAVWYWRLPVAKAPAAVTVRLDI